MVDVPHANELAAFLRGDLLPDRHTAIEAWLDTLSEEQQAALLVPALLVPNGASESEERHRAIHAALSDTDAQSFASVNHGQRYCLTGELGRGGMGIILAATDTVLQRPVAIKILAPRGLNESISQAALRERLFHHEAALLAELNHPGIISVYDVGTGPHGAPAYVMRRLEGHPLTALVERARAGHPLSAPQAAECIMRASEAIAVAHERGIVHRDIKPDNIWAGAHGDIVVIDWGLAGRNADSTSNAGESIGSHAEVGPATAAGVGTPAWMPPEQIAGAAPDPRMDVFALGGVLRALLTGHSPHNTHISTANIPRGLQAVIQRCLQSEAHLRYANAGAVAEDINRWLLAGLTQAENARWPRRTTAWLRQHPAVSGATIAGVTIGAVIVGVITIQAHQQHTFVRQDATHVFTSTTLDSLTAIHTAQDRFAQFNQLYPSDPMITQLFATLNQAELTLQQRQAIAHQRDELHALVTRYDRQGPWVNEYQDIESALQRAGVDITKQPIIDADNPLQQDIYVAATHLGRLCLTNDQQPDTFAAIIHLLNQATDPSWRAMGDLLRVTQTQAHDLIFCECTYSEIVLSNRTTADMLLSVFRPERRLIAYSEDTIAHDPGAFWPRITLARAALSAGDYQTAQRHADVAVGIKPNSFWPHLYLAYVALLSHNDAALAQEIEFTHTANPEHAEVILLQAALNARRGDFEQAKAFAALVGPAHIRYHLTHRVGHPMELAAAALIEAGMSFDSTEPALGPLMPAAQEHDHH